MTSKLVSLVPKRFRPSRVVIPVVRLSGPIADSRRGLSLSAIAPMLDKAFAKPATKAVAVCVNSPGGSPVQSALIHDRIRQLADKNDTQVLVFCEDVAASGGYWLATAGDEIYANASSIIGSIGVIAAGFGFVEAIRKVGVERRVHTAGKNKSILDPFQPEKGEDVERLKELQLDIHEAFIAQVKARRGSKLAADNDDLFTGAFWTGSKALELGLIDGIGHMNEVLVDKFGPDVETKPIARQMGLFGRLGLGVQARGPLIDAAVTDSVIEGLERRALWQRYGL